MARQYKKILKKIKPKEKKAPPKPSYGKDYLLIAALGLTIVFMFVGWANFTIVNRALYVMLFATLSLTYVRRHYNLSDVQDLWAERVGYVTMGSAIILFAINIYQQYFG